MKRIRYLTIQFENPIMAWEIPYFRAAVIEASQRKSSLFHNHGDQGFIYRYPLIQYKVINRNASIVCIEEGTDDIHYLLQNRTFPFNIKGKQQDFHIEEVTLKYVNIQTWEQQFRYNILNWLPLNQDNFLAYKNLRSLVEKITFLENMMRGHLLALFGGLAVSGNKRQIEVQITEIKNERYLKFKSQHMLGFHLNFETNVSLPNYIGIGKGASVGFGIIKNLGNVHSRKRTFEQE